MSPSVSLSPDSALLRTWHGEISLYRAAYGFGGIGLAAASLLGDSVLEAAASVGHAGGWLLWSIVSAGELLIAWIATVATWRSAWRGPAGTGRYGFLAIGFALLFVGAQLVLTIGWTGWAAVAGLGLAPSPGFVLLDQVIRYSSAISG
jgi:hypothetical protein